MKIYKCPRCGYASVQKNDLRKHFFRKKACQVTFQDISLEKCLESYLEPIEVEDEPDNKKQSKKIVENNQNDNFKCNECEKKFSKKNSYYRHRKHFCKGISEESVSED